MIILTNKNKFLADHMEYLYVIKYMDVKCFCFHEFLNSMFLNDQVFNAPLESSLKHTNFKISKWEMFNLIWIWKGAHYNVCYLEG